METHPSSIELLLEKAEQYGKTSVELYRLKAIDRASGIFSSLATNLTLIVFFSLFFLIANVGVALWIGDLMGKLYFGFFSIAAFYAVVGIILYVFRNNWIKTPLRNSFITYAIS